MDEEKFYMKAIVRMLLKMNGEQLRRIYLSVREVLS